MSTVLIVGASRGIGFETVKLALKAGHSVRALARSATAIRSRDPKLEKLDGDALDQHTMERALVGVDAVIQTLGVSPTPELIFSGTRLFSVGTRILVNAMEAMAIKRLICVTGLGAGDSRGYGGPLYNIASWLFLGRIYGRQGCAGVDHTAEPPRLDYCSPDGPDYWAPHWGVSRVGRCARLALWVHLAR
jgi:nucleoside-diphosphate-sugar epimerase